MKRSKTLILSITALLCVFTLGGCVSDNTKLIKGALEVWNSASDKTVTDTYYLDNFTLTAVDIPLIHNSPISINGEIKIVRTFKKNTLNIELLINGIELSADALITSYIKKALGFELSGFKEISISVNINIKNKQVNMSFTALNLHKLKASYPEKYTTGYRGDMTQADSSMYLNYMANLMTTGTIDATEGDYNQTDGVYEYTVKSDKTAQEILRVYKVLLDANSDFKIGESAMPISCLLNEVFGSSDLFNIAAEYCVFSDMKVRAVKGDEKYFTSISAECDDVTILDKDTVERFRQLLVAIAGEAQGSSIKSAIRLQGRVAMQSEYKIN